MSSPLVLVTEVGGTTLRTAVYDPAAHRVSARRSGPTPGPVADEAPAAHHLRVLAALAALAADSLEGRPPDRVGVAYPGPLDGEGRVLAAPTVHRRSRAGVPFDLPAACERTWPGARVGVANDLTAAGLHYVRAGRRDFAVLTVGSGIGHKVFADGRPLVGRGRGGELGHLRLDWSEDAPPCDCGGVGHLGGLASGRGTVAAVRRRAASDPDAWAASALAGVAPERLDGPDVVRAFRAGDPFTRSAVAGAARYLGQGLAALHLDTGVEDVVVVGGFATAMGEDYRRLLVEMASASAWDLGQDWDAIIALGPLAEDAALLGIGHAVTPSARVGATARR